MGAAIGGGFSLAEALLRFSGRASRAIADGDGGFLLAISLSPPHISGIGPLLTTWLPPPVDTLDLFGGAGQGLNYHLVWTALAGLGLALVLRRRGSLRLLGLVPLLYATVDHMATNYAVARPGAKVALGILVDLLAVVRDALPWIVLLALVLATVLDVRALRQVRSAHPDLLLAAERDASPARRATVLVRLAVLAPPWTVLVVLRFLLARRSVCTRSSDRRAVRRSCTPRSRPWRASWTWRVTGTAGGRPGPGLVAVLSCCCDGPC